MILCFAVCCGERYVLQQVVFSGMIYSMMMCWSAYWITVVLGSMMLWFAACCVERYALQQVVFSGMLEVRQHDALVGILGIMLRWATWWAVCWVDWTAWLAELWGSVMWWAAWWVTGCLGQHVVQHDAAGQYIVLGGLLGSFMNNIPLDAWTTWPITRLTSQIYWANLKQNEAKGENISDKR